MKETGAGGVVYAHTAPCKLMCDNTCSSTKEQGQAYLAQCAAPCPGHLGPALPLLLGSVVLLLTSVPALYQQSAPAKPTLSVHQYTAAVLSKYIGCRTC